MISYGKIWTKEDIGTLVSIPSFPDHAKRCPHSGCPTWRQAFGVIVEVFEDRRMVCMVEGKEHYFFFYSVKSLEEK